MIESNGKLKIWYFHGDRTPEGLYYCRRCDSFENCNHFMATTAAAGSAHLADKNPYEANMQKYQAARSFGIPDGYYRPKDADRHNIVL